MGAAKFPMTVKHYIFLIWFLFLSASASAQSSLGVFGALNLSDVRAIAQGGSGDPNDPLLHGGTGKTKISTAVLFLPAIGIYYFKPLQRNTGFQIELLYQRAGFKGNGNNASVFGGGRVNYLTMPVDFRYSCHNIFSFRAGPYLSYRLNTGNDYSSHEFRKTDYGLSVAAEIKIGKRSAAGLHYYFGLPNVYDSDVYTVRNRILQLYLAWKIN